MRFIHIFSCLTLAVVAFAVAGCAAPAPIVNVPAPVVMQVPEPAPRSQEVAACCDCATPYPSIAITQAPSHACEGNCSDFPVSYRVQVPETDSRVRNIDRTLVTSGKAHISKIANCGCNGGSCKTKETK